MTSKVISSERERQSSSQRRGMSIEDFSERYGPGRTKTFEEIRAGRLRAKKIGRRTSLLKTTRKSGCGNCRASRSRLFRRRRLPPSPESKSPACVGAQVRAEESSTTMQKYTNSGEGCNMPGTELVDQVVEHRARHLSRKIGITYDHALAVVLANIIFKGASNG